MSLTVITGCMFAGKTSLLMKHAESVKPECRLIIKPDLDSRYETLSSRMRSIVTHEGYSMNAYAIRTIHEIDEYLRPQRYESYNRVTDIFIDEAQFFSGLLDKVRTLLRLNYRIVVAGLDLTSDKSTFGDILALYPYADTWIVLKARCDSVPVIDDSDPSPSPSYSCPNKAEYTFRLVSNPNTICIGGKESYIPVCGSCYEWYSSRASS